MPFYTFRCTNGHTFDDMQSVNAENPTCPIVIEPTDVNGPIEFCGRSTVKVPSVPGPPKGGDTRKFFPGRG